MYDELQLDTLGDKKTALFLSSGHQLPISRRKRQEFNQIFNAYLGR